MAQEVELPCRPTLAFPAACANAPSVRVVDTYLPVREIRASPLTQAELARKFGVRQTTISMVLTHQRWKEVEAR